MAERGGGEASPCRLWHSRGRYADRLVGRGSGEDRRRTRLSGRAQDLSPDITHKSDVGGVALGLESAEAVSEAASRMLSRVARFHPGADIDGFTVQQMVRKPDAFELILGIVDDATFGPVLLFGQGGTAVEVIRDKAMALPPLNKVLADDLISRTQVSRLLEGYRGHAPADRDAIAAALMALGDLAADNPEVAELDINPLWADGDGIVALDARVRIVAAGSKGTSRYAIRPIRSRSKAH